MDVVLTTSDPSLVRAEDIAKALIDANYYVHSVTVIDRAGVLGLDQWFDDNDAAATDA